ncbi:MAG: hypothetical protein RMH74_03540 [Candidatus Caldarchaeum sp.]|nr:hypothetical protein [Candidatus Caldarchaeum sp.]
MEIRLETVLGSAEVGLFALSTDKYLLVSKQVNPSKRRLFEEVLKTEAVAHLAVPEHFFHPSRQGTQTG